VVGRRAAAVGAALAVAVAAVGAVAPRAVGAGPQQEAPSEDTAAGSDDAVVAIDVDVADGDAVALTGALDEMQANIAVQLRQLDAAEALLNDKLAQLATADGAITVTQGKIDELTTASDSVVVTRFVNPPSETAIEALTADSVADATVKQALLDMRADADAAELSELTAARADLETQREEQEKVAAEADAARQEAEAALEDLQAAAGQEAQFVIDIQSWLADPEGALGMAAGGPEAAAQVESMKAELLAKFQEIEEAEAARQAAAALAEAERRAAEARAAEAAAAEAAAAESPPTGGGGGGGGALVCPVQGAVSFSDTWGAARSGGRSHKGTDMMAAAGTQVVAPANGRVVHDSNSLGGLTFNLYADDGHMYYGAHMSAYQNQGAGWVAAGTPIGKVGSSGNASASAPHLHFEYHPGGGAAVNPYSRLTAAC
jgi:murein DD-endopeptidase MepM/ murein hydrolase activator NlpD